MKAKEKADRAQARDDAKEAREMELRTKSRALLDRLDQGLVTLTSLKVDELKSLCLFHGVNTNFFHNEYSCFNITQCVMRIMGMKPI